MTAAVSPGLERDETARFSRLVALDHDGGHERLTARDARIGRTVIVERLAAGASPDDVAEFLRGVRLQGRLEHPAIAPVLDAGVDPEGRPYAVTPRTEGLTLAAVLRRRADGDRELERTFRLRRLLEAFVDVSLAVAYAHSRGVVHGALVTDDLLLGAYGEVYVRGWRRASGARADAATGPEAAAPVAAAAVDVVALGGILVEVLCLRPLPAGADVHVEARAGAPEARGAGRSVAPELLDASAAAIAATEPAGARRLAEAVQAWLDGVRDSRRRRELAADHRDRARAALILHDRVAAMREASSAVALDPGDDAAAEILGRLVLEPPAPDAPGVAAIVEASDGVEIRAQALVAARSYLAIPLFLPLLWWLGIHAAAVPLAVAALGSAAAAVSLLVSRGRWLRAWVWVSLAGNAVMMVLFSRMFGPLLAVPAMASTLGMTAMTVPGLRPWPLLPVLLVAAVLGPWAAEALGWLQPTTWIEHDALVVTSSVIDLPRGPTLAVLAIHTVTLTAIAAHYMRQLTQVNRDARLRLLSQAWLLEQLAAGDDGAA